jgi:hypothetical protein
MILLKYQFDSILQKLKSFDISIFSMANVYLKMEVVLGLFPWNGSMLEGVFRVVVDFVKNLKNEPSDPLFFH